MALKIPNTLSNLIFSDSQSASLVQQSLSTSVQPLLNFINQYFQTSGSGASVLLTLQQPLTLIKQLLVASGSMQTPGLAFKDNNTLGVFYDQANKRMGVTINNTLVGFVSAAGLGLQSPSAASNAATFYDATGAVIGSYSNAGVFTANSFVSAAGFKCIGPTFFFWGNGGTTTTNYIAMGMPVVAMIGTQTASYTAGQWVPTRAGSVVGISAGFDRANTVSFVFRLTINGTATNQLLQTTGNASATFAKNTTGLTFAANQPIGMQIGTPTAGTPAAVVFANFDIEWGA